MEEEIDSVVTDRVESPQGALDEEGGVGEREILRWGVARNPNSPQRIAGSQQWVFGDVFVVVPNETGVPDRIVGDDYRDDDAEGEKP